MISTLHIFNPGHETAILQGDPNYTPSVTVRKMMEDLALLPAWYARAGDCVWVDRIISPRFFSGIPAVIRPQVTVLSPENPEEKLRTLPPLIAQPWGLTPQILRYYSKIAAITGIQLHVPAWNETWKELTHRKTAAVCLDRLHDLLPDYTLPERPRFFSDPRILNGYLIAHPGSYVIKTPFSSTGRGLLWLKNGQLRENDFKWIEGAIKKQGSVSLEKKLDKVTDLGLEFYSDGAGGVSFKGIAPFITNPNGAYLGTTVCHQMSVLERLSRFMDINKLARIIEALEKVLSGIYGCYYCGCIGVDSFIYNKAPDRYDIHPCVEVNMRNTMGNIALHLNSLIHSKSKGDFNITYDPDPVDGNARHNQRKKSFPLRFEDGKIREGYISLCPVKKDTRYQAFLVVM